MKHLAGLLVIFSSLLWAQVAPPKHESRFHHVFSAHRETDNLEQRYNDMKCALVLILRDDKFGTGFYVSADGDVVTASHVVGERIWTPKDGGLTVDLRPPAALTIINSSNRVDIVPKERIEQNREAWGADLALIRTGTATNCWLSIGDDSLF